MAALAATARPLGFGDLTASAPAACRSSDVMAWIAAALHGGVIEDAGYAAGPDGRPSGGRRYQLTDEGRRRLAGNRRGR